MKTFLFIILIYTVSAGVQRPTAAYLKEFQESFNVQFCGECLFNSSQCENTRKYIIGQAGTGYFNASIPLDQNKFGITEVIEKVFSSESRLLFANTTWILSMDSWLVMPITDKLQGIVVYFHPTTFNRRSVPSLHEGNSYKAIAGLYASRGYAVLMPDYTGFGEASWAPHPYLLYPQQNVQAVIQALNEAYKNLSQTYKQSYFSIYTVGYSEGASYSIWFGKCTTQDIKNCPNCLIKLRKQYNLVKMAGLDGAYEVQKVMMPFLINQVGKNDGDKTFKIENQLITNTIKPGLASLILNSYSLFSLREINSLSKHLNNGFFKMECEIQNSTNQCRIVQGNQFTVEQGLRYLFASEFQTSKAIGFSACNKFTGSKKYTPFKTMNSSHNNSILAVVDQKTVTGPEFIGLARQASIGYFGNETTKQILLFSLARDSIFSVLNTESFSNSSGKVQKIFLENSFIQTCNVIQDGPPVAANFIDHVKAEIIANIYALSFIDGTTTDSKKTINSFDQLNETQTQSTSKTGNVKFG